jgi:hypothetical protein
MAYSHSRAALFPDDFKVGPPRPESEWRREALVQARAELVAASTRTGRSRALADIQRHRRWLTRDGVIKRAQAGDDLARFRYRWVYDVLVCRDRLVQYEKRIDRVSGSIAEARGKLARGVKSNGAPYSAVTLTSIRRQLAGDEKEMAAAPEDLREYLNAHAPAPYRAWCRDQPAPDTPLGGRARQRRSTNVVSLESARTRRQTAKP